jgi:hypothetical protein
MTLDGLSGEIDAAQREAEAAILRLDAVTCEVTRRGNRSGIRWASVSASGALNRMDGIALEARARLYRLRQVTP